MNNQVLSTLLYSNTQTYENLFSLAIQQSSSSTQIKMRVTHKTITTADLPFIVEILQKQLPSVLLTECYNDDNLPFAIEVKNTEIGHLFEHILLEYLCQLKIAKGSMQASFAGRTKWNWITEPR